MSAEDFEGVASMAGLKRELLEDKRIESTAKALNEKGFEVFKSTRDEHLLVVVKNGKKVQFWPYTGWYNTVGFKKRFPTARGFKNLLKEFA